KVPIHSPVTSVSSRRAGNQAKLSVSSPGDAAEHEADQIADQVMRIDFARINLALSTPASTVRSAANLNTTAAADAAPRGGAPMPNDQLSYFQPRFGHDFSQVRIHTDSSAAAGARVVQARAYTVGRDIVFG